MKALKLQLLSLCILLASQSFGQDSLGIARVEIAYQTVGSINDYVVDGPNIYAATTTGLHIMNRFDRDIVSTARYNQYRPIQIFLRNDNLIMLCAEENFIGQNEFNYELIVVEKAAPDEIISRTDLSRLGFFYIGEENKVLLADDLLFIPNPRAGAEAIFIFDLSDPAHPEQTGSIDLRDIRDTPIRMAFRENHFFAQFHRPDRLYIYDLENPRNPLQPDFPRISSFAIQDSRLAVSYFDDNEYITALLDIGNLEDMNEVGRFVGDRRGWVHAEWMAFVNEKLYVQYTNYIARLDISNLDEIRIDEQSPELDAFYLPTIQQDTLYTLFYYPVIERHHNSFGIAMLDVNVDHDIQLLAWHHPTPTIRSLSVSQNKVIVFENPSFGQWDNLDIDAIAQVRILDSQSRNEIRADGRFSIEPPRQSIFQDLVVYGDYAYYADPNYEEILTYETDERDRLVDQFGSQATTLEINRNFLYSAIIGGRQFTVFDVSDPLHPEESGVIDYGRSIGEFKCVNDLAFIREERGNWEMFRIVEPTRLERIVTFAVNKNIEVLGDKLFLQRGNENHSGSRLQIWDIADPEERELLGELDSSYIDARIGVPTEGFVPLIVHKVIDNHNIYKLEIIDLSDPEHPTVAGHYESSDVIIDAALSGSAAFVAFTGHLALFDCSIAMNINPPPLFRNPPVELSYTETDTVRFNLLAADLNGGDLELTALNLPEGSSFIDQGDGQGTFTWLTDFTSAGEYAPVFVVSDGELTDTAVVQITVNNVNRPPIFDLFANIEPPDSSAIPESDTVRFVWSNASDPDGDDLIYTLLLEGNRDHFYFNAGADTSREVRRRDLLALLADSLSTISWRVMATDGTDTVYSRSAFTLLPPLGVPDFILHPSSFSLSPPFPNPFNSSTVISFSLPKPGRYALDVVDIQGRLVTRLAEGWKEAGSYHQVLNASDVPSGLLMLKLSSNLESRVQTLQLIK